MSIVNAMLLFDCHAAVYPPERPYPLDRSIIRLPCQVLFHVKKHTRSSTPKEAYQSKQSGNKVCAGTNIYTLALNAVLGDPPDASSCNSSTTPLSHITNIVISRKFHPLVSNQAD